MQKNTYQGREQKNCGTQKRETMSVTSDHKFVTWYDNYRYNLCLLHKTGRGGATTQGSMSLNLLKLNKLLCLMFALQGVGPYTLIQHKCTLFLFFKLTLVCKFTRKPLLKKQESIEI